MLVDGMNHMLDVFKSKLPPETAMQVVPVTDEAEESVQQMLKAQGPNGTFVSSSGWTLSSSLSSLSSLKRDGKPMEIMIGDSMDLSGPYSRYPMTITRAKRQSKRYSSKILGSWAKLNSILQGRESMLHKRWTKKTVEQRKKILLEAWPGMPVRHRPDLEILAKGRTFTLPESSATAVFKWPHITIEDLTPVNCLLLLLNTRGRNHPDSFAHVDLAACSVGLLSYRLQVPDLYRQVMIIAGQKAEEIFGQIVSWEDDFEAFYHFTAGVNFDAGMGLLALEIQSRILEFLVECCHRILHDIPTEELYHVEALPTNQSEAIAKASSTPYLQLSAMVAEAPFKPPTKLDTHHLLLFVEARRAAAEDHIWEMRDDPGYFQSILLEGAEHPYTRMPTRRGKLYEYHDDEVSWSHVINRVLTYEYMSYFTWANLSRLAKKLDTKVRPLLHTLDHQQPLAEDIEDTILEFIWIAETLFRSVANVLKYGIESSVRVSGTYSTHQDDQPMVLFLQLWNSVTTLNDENERDPLAQGDETNVLHILVDEFQRLIHDSPRHKKRMTSQVSAIFSDLALLSTIIRQLMGFFPWASSFRRNLILRSPANDDWYKEMSRFVVNVYLYRVVLGDAEASRLQPIKTSLHYPIHKAYNEANVEALRKAESNLDTFWKGVDDVFVQANGESLLYRFCRSASPRELRRTAPWIPPLQSAQVLPKIDGELAPPFAKLELTPEKSTRFRIQAVPSKVKTRGSADTSDAITESTPQVDTASGSELNEGKLCTATLSNRAAKVFRALFSSPWNGEQQHEIRWSDFLHAMGSIGFATEKLYGSVWHFTPKTFQADRSIHVHEPHPGDKIPLNNARRLGRRLSRNYGWTGEMFAPMEE